MTISRCFTRLLTLLWSSLTSLPIRSKSSRRTRQLTVSSPEQYINGLLEFVICTLCVHELQQCNEQAEPLPHSSIYTQLVYSTYVSSDSSQKLQMLKAWQLWVVTSHWLEHWWLSQGWIHPNFFFFLSFLQFPFLSFDPSELNLSLTFLFSVIDAIVVSMDAIVNAARFVEVDADKVTNHYCSRQSLLFLVKSRKLAKRPSTFSQMWGQGTAMIRWRTSAMA